MPLCSPKNAGAGAGGFRTRWVRDFGGAGTIARRGKDLERREACWFPGGSGGQLAAACGRF